MELREFVTETLVAIQEGVRAAIERVEESKAIGVVNPVWDSGDGEKVDWKEYAQAVEFDVAVTATDTTGARRAG